MTSLDGVQIDRWIGSGENSAGFVLDWNDGAEAEVWGYRWSGTVTGEEMFRDIVTTDDSLFAKWDAPGSFGRPVYGIGYDRDPQNFALDDGTTFPANGLLETSPPDADGIAANAIAAEDSYFEGWFTNGYWSYWNAQNPFGAPGADGWTSNFGANTRVMVDGDWDGWSAAVGFSATAPDVPAAVPEPGTWLLVLLAAGGGGLATRRRGLGRAATDV
ncbi:PEP-CTERM sorting domain-containing protein [Alienimonas californiensis]|uniref:PEP-CTERM sorting domain-containing protein n=1 Tax=Alienimonas californiensis TaxID=2527989 RepID=UPI0013FCF8B3|nr:PEP-CTERM sorting domain-containing protein [Alienimonas californiensis]